jgi:hypothetical protein
MDYLDGKCRFMQKQIEEKLEKGFNCIKLKIGVDWESEKKFKNLEKNFLQKL